MLILFAVQITVILAVCSFALNAGWLELTKVRLQTAADAAAIEAAAGIAAGLSQAQWTADGKADAGLNGFTDGVGGVSVTFNNPPATGSYTSNTSAVQAVVSQLVSPLLPGSAMTLTARSTALGTQSPCTFLLSSASTPSLNAWNETMTGTCPIYLGQNYQIASNSSSSGAPFLVAGASTQSAGSVSPAPTFGYSHMADPLSYVTQPAIPACTYNNQTINLSSNTVTLASNAVYCGNTTMSGTGTINFSTGTHIFAGTVTIGLNTTDHITLQGTNTTLFLTAYNGSTGTNTINGTINLIAPTSGSMEGIMIMVDRTLPAGSAPLNLGYWGGNHDGIVYALGQLVTAGDITARGIHYFGIVADSMAAHNTTYTPNSDYSTLADGNPYRLPFVTMLE